ncbi:MAG TPA: ATP-binding protein, partial [Cyclobacteriaceae bacterium]
IKNPNKPDRDFLEESNELLIILDSLMAMHWKDTVQVSRLAQMKTIIKKRNNLFLSYLRLRSNVIKDKVMARKFDSLSTMLSKENITSDTSVRTSQKKSTTITYLQDTAATEGQKRSFLSKLFKKRPGPESVPLPDRTVTEEVQVTVDTIAIAQNNKRIAEINNLIDQLGMKEIRMRKKIADRELALLATSRQLFSELVGIVHLVEVEELEGVRQNNAAALDVVDESSGVIVAILLIFAMMAAALVYLIVIDVTKSNFYREGLVREKERAEELSQVKERFLSNMSHEIRTPLQAIIGYSEQLRLNPLADADTAIKAIGKSSEHLLHIVNEVLDYTRLESGKIEFEKKEFYPLEIAEEVASALQVQAEKKGLELVFDTTMTTNELAEGDEFRLRQVLYNLLGNAIKFTSTGQVKLIVSGFVDQQHRLRMKFEVSDTGIGIRPKDIERIFHRFEQADANVGSTYGGTGLGLTIVKMLVEGQGGKIHVRSAEGMGSSFIVEISYAHRLTQKTTLVVPSAKAPQNIRVLVLDDDQTIVELCGLMLSSANIPFETHPNPGELFTTNVNPDITHILMDIRMGNVNGVDLHASLKKRVGKNVKMFAMTAIAQTNLDQFDGVLRKPFRAEDLYRLLGNEDRFSIVRKMTNHDEELFRSVIADFVGETNKDILLVEKAINEEQDKEVLLLVHRLAGRTNQFGFPELSISLRRIENELEQGVATRNLKNKWDQLKGDIHAALLTI